MKRSILLSLVAIWIAGISAYGQAPTLTIKKDLPTSLKGSQTFTNTTGVDTVQIPYNYSSDFTLEVKGKVTSAEGRGMDIEARRKDGSGYRTSLSPSYLYWSSTISQISTIAFSSNEEQTLRYAVEGNVVHIFKNGLYLESKPMESIRDIENDIEIEPEPEISGNNFAQGWAGTSGNNSGKATDYGWGVTSGTGIGWGNANGTSGIRYMDIASSAGIMVNSEPWSGRYLYLRWDGSIPQSTQFYYEIEGLEAKTTYQFSFLYTLYSNVSNGTITVGFSKENTGNNILSSKSFNRDLNKLALYDGKCTFTTDEGGNYYLMVSANAKGLWAIADLSIRKSELEPRIIIGKNYQNGAVNMQISSVTFDNTGAYAPEQGSANIEEVMITDEIVNMYNITNKKVTVTGKSELHITSIEPMTNSSINLTSDDAWLYIENIKPSKVLSSAWLENVTINGQPIVNGTNARIAMYVQGTVIIPNRNQTDQSALTVYNGQNFTGESTSYAVEVFNTNLGAFDNKIRSFKLKKGYAATLANNPNGTGFSRVFIADDDDLEISEMPEGLEFVSFIRVLRWDWVSKKGWCGTGYNASGSSLDITNSTWFYNWSGSGNTESNDYVFTPIRQNGGWPSWETIKSLKNVANVLGYNEPERPDQANITVEAAINQWPEMFKTGLRIGSPAPASRGVSWQKQFMALCDSLNYRIDFAAVHCYEGKTSPASWTANLRSYYESGNAKKRPIWITEWNNGANWTDANETWPSDLAEAEQKQLNDLKGILKSLDESPYVERYSIYNWVTDKRRIVRADNETLTPAGEYYAANPSAKAYNKSVQYDHQWKIAPPWIKQSLSNDYNEITLSWYDHNGETGKNYILERKLDSENDYTVIATFKAGTDYEFGGTINYKERLAYNAANYRIKATSYKDTESIYSREAVVKKDPSPATPIITGEAISSSILKIKWEAVANARSYNIKRATSANGSYEIIASYYNDSTAYIDNELPRNTTFHYKISALNSSGEGVDSKSLELTTKDLDIPGSVENFYLSSGDGEVALTWNFEFDTQYKIMRSQKPDGDFITVADNFEGTRYADKSGITNGTTYYYKVIGKNIMGEGPESAVLEANPKTGQHLRILFNENDGTLAHDDWGGYHGTLQEDAQWVPAEDGTGVALSASDKSYIQLGNDVVKDLNDFTIASWFKTPEGGNKRLFDFGSGTSTFMMLSPQANATQSRYKITTSAGSYDAYMDCVIPFNEWVHMVITQNGKEFKLYMNGELQFTGENTDGINPSHMGSTSNNYLGRSQWSTDPYTNHSYDDFRIYNYALAEKDIKKLYNREEINPNQVLNILDLTVNGHAWNIKDKYIMDCSNATNQLTIEVATEPNVSVLINDVVAPDNKIILGNLNNPGQSVVNFTLRDDNDPTITTDYTLNVEKYFAFDDIVGQRWNNTLDVNNNSATNGGYKFISYKWYKNGQLVSTKQYYTAGPNKEDLLDTNAEYYVEVTTSEGKVFRTCSSTITLNKVSVKVYPSPVSKGEMLNIELSMDQDMINKATIEIYDTNGNRIINRKADGILTSIYTPNGTGVYIVNVKSGNFSEQQKIIIK